MYPNYYEPRTVKGLKYINLAWILYIVALVILLIMLIVLIPVLMEAFNDPDDFDPSNFGILFGIIAGACLSGLFSLIVVILFLIGIIYMLTGREEFGPQHSSRVMLGFIFLLIGFIIPVFGGFGTAFSYSGYGSAIYITSGFSIASSILMALGLVFLIENLLDEKWKRILWTGGLIFIIFSIIAAAINIWLFTSLISDISDPETFYLSGFSTFTLVSSGLTAMNLLPIFIFLLCYRQAEQRIRTGELKVVQPMYPPPPPPYYYPPPPPAYYPPPAYGYPPPAYGYPPPAVPPSGPPGTPRKCPSCEKEAPLGIPRCPNCGFYFG